MMIPLVDFTGDFVNPRPSCVQRHDWAFCAPQAKESFVRDTCVNAMLKAPAEVSLRMRGLPDAEDIAERVEHWGVSFLCVDRPAVAKGSVFAQRIPVGVPVSSLVDAQASRRTLRAFGS